MTLRLPIIPTLIVALAIFTMVGLGIWQLQRKGEKEAVLKLAAANPSKAAVSFPRIGPVDMSVLFRPSSVQCLRVEGWRVEAGRSADGKMGFRHIAECVTGAEGPGALVEVGVGQRPDQKLQWSGGQVQGWIAEEPDHRSLLSRLGSEPQPLRPMLIAKAAPEGLSPAAPPNVKNVPNNHIAYAVQWFVFAVLAAFIYIIALKRKRDGR